MAIDNSARGLAKKALENIPNIKAGTNITIAKDGQDITINGSGTVSANDDLARQEISDLTTTVNKKADKVTNATSGNFAGLDSNGNLIDSGKNASNFVQDASYIHTDNNYTNVEKSKLSGLNNQIQSDFNQTDNTKLDYIKNKPTIPSKTSQLTNDSNFGTGDMQKSVYDTNNDGVVDHATKADKTDILTDGNTLNYSAVDIKNMSDTVGNKVDKVTGKGLSTEDLTTALKTSYDSAVTNSHTHTNKTTLDNINQELSTTSSPTFAGLTVGNINYEELKQLDGIDTTQTIQAQINTLKTMIKIQGVINKESDLPATPVTKDAYIVATPFTHSTLGALDKNDCIYYNGTAWVYLMNFTNIDLTPYFNKTNDTSDNITEGTSHKFITTDEINKLSGITANATKVESSTTNGNVKINGTETVVYNDVALTTKITNISSDLVTFTATLDNTTNISFSSVSGLNLSTAIYEIFYKGVMLEKTTNYTVNANNTSIDLVGWSIKTGESIKLKYFTLS